MPPRAALRGLDIIRSIYAPDDCDKPRHLGGREELIWSLRRVVSEGWVIQLRGFHSPVPCEVTDHYADEVDLIGRRRGAIKEFSELRIDRLSVETDQRADEPSQPFGVFHGALDVFRSAGSTSRQQLLQRDEVCCGQLSGTDRRQCEIVGLAAQVVANLGRERIAAANRRSSR
jgi:hypothetical protein